MPKKIFLLLFFICGTLTSTVLLGQIPDSSQSDLNCCQNLTSDDIGKIKHLLRSTSLFEYLENDTWKSINKSALKLDMETNQVTLDGNRINLNNLLYYKLFDHIGIVGTITSCDSICPVTSTVV